MEIEDIKGAIELEASVAKSRAIGELQHLIEDAKLAIQMMEKDRRVVNSSFCSVAGRADQAIATYEASKKYLEMLSR